MSAAASKVWLITGASKGLGRQWAEAALERGDRVVAAARGIDGLDGLANAYGDLVLPIALDIRDREASAAVVARTVHHFGGIDVLVNNAGYGTFGMIEETTEAQARDQFETNFFGTLWMTQAALPVMRERGRGHIIQISSVAGVSAIPGLGMYCASKWALEGMAESLAGEVRGFGIKVTLVEPSGYATQTGGADGTMPETLAAYDGVRTALFKAQTSQVWGDPRATRAAMLAVADADEPPVRVFFGDGPLGLITGQYAERIAMWQNWEHVSVSASGTSA